MLTWTDMRISESFCYQKYTMGTLYWLTYIDNMLLGELRECSINFYYKREQKDVYYLKTS